MINPPIQLVKILILFVLNTCHKPILIVRKKLVQKPDFLVPLQKKTYSVETFIP